jgi:hypothetical protein
MKPTWFDTQSDIVVVGTDPENVDYNNQRGEVYGFAAYVRASNPYGDTRVLHVCTEMDEAVALDKAGMVAERLNTRLLKLGKLPVGFDTWQAGRPVYGSDAYAAYGQADDAALERKEFSY